MRHSAQDEVFSSQVVFGEGLCPAKSLFDPTTIWNKMEAEYKVIEMVSPKIPMFNVKPTFQIPFLIGSPDKFPGFAPHVWKVTAGCLSWKRTRYL
jgi:hypothetical protein